MMKITGKQYTCLNKIHSLKNQRTTNTNSWVSETDLNALIASVQIELSSNQALG